MPHIEGAFQCHDKTFEFAIHHLFDSVLDISEFELGINNEVLGASAYHPKYLLKIILYAYSMGVTSSRGIANLCTTNINMMILAGGLTPKKSKITEFIISHTEAVEVLFLNVLTICYQEGLVGNHLFAIDGCKLPSNASKEWSGTREEFEKQKKKLENTIRFLIRKHREEDTEHTAPERFEAEQKQIAKLKDANRKYKSFLKNHRDKIGTKNNPISSNITDNDSAKLKSSHGYTQGYCAVTVSDYNYQTIVATDIFGFGNERWTVKPMLEQIRKNMNPLIETDDIFEWVKLLGDAGFTSEETLELLSKEKVDAYFADANMRKRDSRFKNALKKHSPRANQNPRFTHSDFFFDLEQKVCICPMGKHMRLKSQNAKSLKYPTLRFEGRANDCRNCESRKQCLKNEHQKTARQIAWRKGKDRSESITKAMQSKIDSNEGKAIYHKRLGIIEPVFANITSTLKLNRLNYRGKAKNNAQWKLYCIVHNIGKIMRYGPIAA